ncbi:regulatory protein RecX [Sphingorhabdus contaminans]|uniref:Regulatory protein RecX n=1 Tax=Sphingorhabdus contaminans TaxID=1343899 RepID=A0A553WKW3_9SPHN|nr:regulatory protein RecX [Sphingorhabdus contaminans]TSB05306.1 regulatory protein RecX [Sphingorhabdus contaminans]
MYRPTSKSPPPALNEERLRELALRYVGKYATSRAKLALYLKRKISERSWEDNGQPDIETLVNQFSELGYINDAQFAEARGRSFIRRGYGKRKLYENLRAAGIEDDDATSARKLAEMSEFSAAENFARRKRIGPFAQEKVTEEKRRKDLQAFLRAGHGWEISRRFVNADPGDLIDEY